MNFRRFTGNKPSPLGSSIPALTKVKQPSKKGYKQYSMRSWKNGCLNRTVQIIEGEERWICYLCNAVLKLGQVTIDHVIPQSKGGTSAMSNLQPCCLSCNGEKADKLPKLP